MIHIREAMGSYLILDTGYSEILCDSSQSVRENRSMSPRLCHYRFLPNPLQFIRRHTVRRCVVRAIRTDNDLKDH
jgi:hypothetical protein